jgi:Flp pilus assembly protein TadD
MADMLGGRLPEARALFERAVDAMPGHIGTWLAYGWCLLFLGDRADARAAFGRALALDANFGESHGALAVVDALEGHAGPARDGIRRAHGLEPGGLAAAYAQALLDGQAHDPQRFLALAERVLGRHATPDGRRLADVVLARR